MTENVTMHSADDLIAQEESIKLGIKETPQPKSLVEEAEKISNTDPAEGEPLYSHQEEKAEDSKTEEAQSTEPKEVESPEESSAEDIDPYGNKTKEKLYTSEEVNRMIRERLKNRYSEQPKESAPEVNQSAEGDENWEVQLEGFIEKTLEKRESKRVEEQSRQREIEAFAEFESKFAQGMNKYGDFESVVKGKPVTDSMMMATRSMQDPAAFIYAACKQAPQEVERIAKIPDPIAQIAEIGRLEERMRKARAATKAPAPTDKLSSNVTTATPKVNIDSLIHQHGIQKLRKR